MKENISRPGSSEKEIQEAKLGFERMARRLDELLQKDRLTQEEQKEKDLLFNNALVLDEMLRGETPEEVGPRKKTRKK